MRILVDADACPVINIVEELGELYNKEVILFYDTSHVTNKYKSKIIMVDKWADSVDYAIVNYVNSFDLVVTQDYGLASMVLARGAICIHQNGFIYNKDNISSLLETRAIGQKLRKSSKNHLKGPKKRTKEDDLKFFKCLEEILKNDK